MFTLTKEKGIHVCNVFKKIAAITLTSPLMGTGGSLARNDITAQTLVCICNYLLWHKREFWLKMAIDKNTKWAAALFQTESQLHDFQTAANLSRWPTIALQWKQSPVALNVNLMHLTQLPESGLGGLLYTFALIQLLITCCSQQCNPSITIVK